MKFRSTQEKQLFLLEINRVDLIDSTDTYEPTEEELKSFIKSRKNIIPKMADFRRSQASKDGWRKNRYAMKKGIKSFHKSTAGKRFHRKLGSFLANRDKYHSPFKRESLGQPTIVNEVVDILKSLSSLRTHLLIEFEYYHSIEEEVDLHLLYEFAIPVICRIEDTLLTGYEINIEDIQLLCDLTETASMVAELSTVTGCKSEKINGIIQEVQTIYSEEDYLSLEMWDSIKELSISSKDGTTDEEIVKGTES